MQIPPPTPAEPKSSAKSKTLFPNLSSADPTLLLTDNLLLNILSRLPLSQRNPNSLVCKRWLNLQGRLVRSLKILDWEFLESGRLITRFLNLTEVDLLNGCLISPNSSCVWLTQRVVSMNIGSGGAGFAPNWQACEEILFPVEIVDRGLKALASGSPNLRKLVVMGASELGVLSMAEECFKAAESEPAASSISDATTEEEVAFCLILF